MLFLNIQCFLTPSFKCLGVYNPRGERMDAEEHVEEQEEVMEEWEEWT